MINHTWFFIYYDNIKESQNLHYSGYRRARLHDMSQMPTSKWMQIITHSGVLFSVETRHNTQQQNTAKDEHGQQDYS